ncbi:hypothetical protein Y032_0274g1014 [Ancylostoma ceylanicum]|uniref:Uncharacterized protein n=1 Tax=Ancylostoma ceylanicum TaxID=53326 RepID=A0A016S7V4_9BILA|nr:hypothetical protein Y032_0274g1014 [Ancylostoma ceylanicum]
MFDFLSGQFDSWYLRFVFRSTLIFLFIIKIHSPSFKITYLIFDQLSNFCLRGTFVKLQGELGVTNKCLEREWLMKERDIDGPKNFFPVI